MSASTTGKVVRSGFLMKRGEVNPAYQKRWFILRETPTVISYHKDSKSKALGTIPLCDYILGLDASKENGLLLLPRAKDVTRTYHLEAPTKEQQHQWIDAFTRVGVPLRRPQTDESAYAIKQGLLKKQGGKTKNWKQRWFLIRRGVMFYFENREACDQWKPLGAIPLCKTTNSDVEPDFFDKPNVFQLFHPQRRTYYFQAERDMERKLWTHAFELARAEPPNLPDFGKMTGWLEESLGKDQWRKLWFVLEQNVIYNAKAPTDFRINHAFDLDGYTMNFIREPTHNKFPITFRHPQQGSYVVYASSVEEQREWISQIVRSIKATESLRTQKGHVGDVRPDWEISREKDYHDIPESEINPLNNLLANQAFPAGPITLTSAPSSSGASLAQPPPQPSTSASASISLSTSTSTQDEDVDPEFCPDDYQHLMPEFAAPAPTKQPPPTPEEDDDDDDDEVDSDFDFDSDDLDLADDNFDDSGDEDARPQPSTASASSPASATPAPPPSLPASTPVPAASLPAVPPRPIPVLPPRPPRNGIPNALRDELTAATQSSNPALIEELSATSNPSQVEAAVVTPPVLPPRPVPDAKRSTKTEKSDTINRMYEEATIKTGVLLKLGGNSNAWQRRVFVLKPNYLAYFKTPDDLQPTGVIHLKRSTVGSSSRRENCLCINKLGRTYFIACSNPAEKDEWMSAIQQCVELCLEMERMEEEKAHAALQAHAESHSESQSSSILRRGYMSKRGGNRKNWSVRFFTLQPGVLSYAKNESTTKALGVIHLVNAIIQDSDRKPYSFTITVPNRTYFIDAKSYLEKEEWVTALRKASSHC